MGFGDILSGIAARGPAIKDLTGRLGSALAPSTAMQNASAWRNGGYDQWRQGDPQREQALPIGGVAPQRPESGFDAIRNDLSQIRNGPSVKYSSNARKVQNNPTASPDLAAPSISFPTQAAPRF